MISSYLLEEKVYGVATQIDSTWSINCRNVLFLTTEKVFFFHFMEPKQQGEMTILVPTVPIFDSACDMAWTPETIGSSPFSYIYPSENCHSLKS
jgi:hypothetical protein